MHTGEDVKFRGEEKVEVRDLQEARLERQNNAKRQPSHLSWRSICGCYKRLSESYHENQPTEQPLPFSGQRCGGHVGSSQVETQVQSSLSQADQALERS